MMDFYEDEVADIEAEAFKIHGYSKSLQTFIAAERLDQLEMLESDVSQKTRETRSELYLSQFQVFPYVRREDIIQISKMEAYDKLKDRIVKLIRLYKVFSVGEIKPGNHLTIKYGGLQIAHCIVIAEQTKLDTDIHEHVFSAVGWIKNQRNGNPSIQEFNFRLTNPDIKEISVADYTDEKCYSVEETIRRAQERIGESDYSFDTNHAHGFPRWCKTGYGGAFYSQPRQRDSQLKKSIPVSEVKLGQHISWWDMKTLSWRNGKVVSAFKYGMLSVMSHDSPDIVIEMAFDIEDFVFLASTFQWGTIREDAAPPNGLKTEPDRHNKEKDTVYGTLDYWLSPEVTYNFEMHYLQLMQKKHCLPDDDYIKFCASTLKHLLLSKNQKGSTNISSLNKTEATPRNGYRTNLSRFTIEQDNTTATNIVVPNGVVEPEPKEIQQWYQKLMQCTKRFISVLRSL